MLISKVPNQNVVLISSFQGRHVITKMLSIFHFFFNLLKAFLLVFERLQYVPTVFQLVVFSILATMSLSICVSNIFVGLLQVLREQIVDSNTF